LLRIRPYFSDVFSFFSTQIYNRTSMQHSNLVTNGHTRPIEKLRYMDRYLVSGGRDATVKIWAL
jgi:division protein 1